MLQLPAGILRKSNVSKLVKYGTFKGVHKEKTHLRVLGHSHVHPTVQSHAPKSYLTAMVGKYQHCKIPVKRSGTSVGHVHHSISTAAHMTVSSKRSTRHTFTFILYIYTNTGAEDKQSPIRQKGGLYALYTGYNLEGDASLPAHFVHSSLRIE